ncbi:MAG: hypothetical protein J5365_06305 [Erysipelotrichaceae bacterium]|nr:hypothetical protein [Erysipelotrichaceae bacterium]
MNTETIAEAVKYFFILIAVYVVFTTGEGLFPKVKRRFTRRCYADKGLHSLKQDIPENSLEAVKRAADQRYGSRIDVRLTKDLIPVLFSDSDLSRAAKDQRRIEDMTYEEVANIIVFGSHHIDKLQDVLEALDKYEEKALMLNLICSDTEKDKVTQFCKAVTEVFYPYRRFCCVESHNYRVIHFYAANYSNIVRGLRMLPREESDLSDKEFEDLNRMRKNMSARPQFFDTAPDLYSRYYWVPVTMGSFLAMRGANGEADRLKIAEEYKTDTFIFSKGTPKSKF